jgi:sugar lactone lactonase YvrE
MYINKQILIVSLFLIISVFAVAAAQEREVIFSDDFSSYIATEPAEQTAELAKKWCAFNGHWYVKDGVLNQDNGGFDLGIVARDLFLRCDYRMETKVRLISGGAGAGLYWNVADELTGENGNMLRYDGQYPIMYGFMRSNGFAGTGGATGDLSANNTWHDLRMDVVNSKGTFDVYWDGKKIVDAASMLHRCGYAGLQCSMGYSQFDDFKISVEKGTDWKAAPKGQVIPEWIESFDFLPDGNIVYPVPTVHRIQIVSPDGKLVREFGEFGSSPGQLNVPGAIAVDKNGSIYVTERGGNRVQIFSPDGKSIKILAPAGKDALIRPFGIAVDAAGRVWVGDTGNKRLAVLKDDSTVIGSIGSAAVVAAAQDPGAAVREPGQFARIQHISFIEGRIWVADPTNGRIQIFNPDNLTEAPRIITIPWVKSVAFNGKDRYVVASERGAAIYDSSFSKPLARYDEDASGEVWASQVRFDRDGNIIISDWWNHRLLFASPKLAPMSPSISDMSDISATITWQTDLPTTTKLMLLDTAQPVTWVSSEDYSKAKVFTDDKSTTEHVVKLTGLKPGTRYTYAIEAPRKIIPSSSRSSDFRFVTKASAGRMAYSQVPVAVICYGHVTYDSIKAPDGKPYPPVIRDEAWFNGFACRNAGETVRYFYWTNTFFKWDLKMYYLFVQRPTDIGFLGSSSEVVYNDVLELAKREKMNPEDFGGVITIGGGGTYAYPWPTPWWGGKLTYSTGCCFTGGGGIWLLTHEFHHVTEGWMHHCGYPGYNSADSPWTHPGRFGENFDFLAHTLRYMPSDAYLNCPFGKIKMTADKDADGVPDDEPDAVWDEKRAGTSPENKNSYGNGLSDLENLTADNFNPTPMGVKNNNPMLTKKVDYKFPFAVFDCKYERPKRTINIDGTFDEKQWDFLAATPNPGVPKPVNPVVAMTTYSGVMWGSLVNESIDCRMKTYMNWDDDNIYVAVSAPYKFSACIQLDCNADGYFHGHDNITMEMPIPRNENDEKASPPNTLMPPPNVMVWNCKESPETTGFPQWDNNRFNNKDKIKWAWGKNPDGWYFVTIAVPKTEAVDLVPTEGKEIGICFGNRGYLPPTEKNPDPRFLPEMFDSCEYGYFKLVK